MQELIDTRMIEDVCDGLQVLKDVRWVRHAQSEHGVVGHYFDYAPEKCWKICVYVAAVCTGVLAGQPYFHHAFLDGLMSPLHDSLGSIGSKLTACMPSLAVCTRAKAACRKRNDLDELILANFRQIKPWKLFLGKELHLVTLQGFLYDFNNSVNLGDTKYAHVFQTFETSITLGHAARHNDRLPHVLCFLDQIDEFLL